MCENIRIYRLYCSLSQEDVAEALAMSLDRYQLLEKCEAAPDEEELERFAKLYNVSVSEFTEGISCSDKFVIVQSIDDNLYFSDEHREFAKSKITDLSDLEKRIILAFRSAHGTQETADKIINIICEDV